MTESLFGRVISKGLLGAVIGLFGGLVLGLVIAILSHLTAYIDMKLLEQSYSSAPPVMAFATLGMSFGTIFGAFFGGVAGFKEKK